MKKIAIITMFVAFLILPPLMRLIRSPFFSISLIYRMAGLIGFTLMSYQFIVSGRIPLLEQTFGQDKLIFWHRGLGIAAFIIIVAHGPLYLVNRYVTEGTLSISLPQDLPVFSGTVGFFIMLLLTIAAAFRLSLKIPYDIWKKTHKVFYVIYPMLFLHAMLIGGTVRSTRLVYIQFIVMFALVFFTWIWRLSLYLRTRKQPYMLSRTTALNYNVNDFAFAGPPLDYRPGQFGYLTLTRDGKALPPHPFTISSSPLDKDVRFTIKESGDFTREISSLSSGTEAYIEGPYGLFSHTRIDRSRKLLFIAGGVGITPFLSMLRILKDDDPDRQVVMLWGNRSTEDLFFMEELEGILQNMKNLSIIHVFSDRSEKAENIASKDFGYVDATMVGKYAPNANEYEIFLCGPPVMMDKLEPALKKAGYPGSQIHLERFGF